jgi:putative flippase GtrA
MVIFMIGSYLAVFAVNLFLLTILVEKFNFNKYAAQAMALSVSAGLSFFVQKFFIFHKKDGETGY